MTEKDWLSTHDVSELLWCPQIDSRSRSLRLLGCACCRLLGKWIEDDEMLSAVDAAERHADDRIAFSTLSRRATRVRKRWQNGKLEGKLLWKSARGIAVLAVLRACDRHPRSSTQSLIEYITDGEKRVLKESYGTRIESLLRDIFGNPFRPVSFDPVWRTSTAVAISKGMYDSRDFSAMPILADALQDAGCENEDVLNHCRAADGVHVRGCWVVDLVLGKS